MKWHAPTVLQRLVIEVKHRAQMRPKDSSCLGPGDAACIPYSYNQIEPDGQRRWWFGRDLEIQTIAVCFPQPLRASAAICGRNQDAACCGP